MNHPYSTSEVIDKVSYTESIGIKNNPIIYDRISIQKTNNMEKTLELIEVLPSSHTQCHILPHFQEHLVIRIQNYIDFI